VERDQPRRRLKQRMFSVHGAIGAGAIVVSLLLVRWLGGHTFGPRSSAVFALILFAAMLGVVVLWPRTGRPEADVSGEADEGPENYERHESYEGYEDYEG
jgi:hypothetical protein